MWPILRNFIMVLCLMAVGVIAIRDYTLLFDTPRAEISAEKPQKPENPQDHSENGWEIEIEAGSHGHFRVEAEINGDSEGFLVDTGASLVSFSLETAERLGFYESSLDFNARSRTANGLVDIALVTLDEVTIGDLTLRNVKAAIRRTRTGPSLLGMSFLRRLDGYEVRQGKLVLRW
jgi:aspartyl protease family protein